MPSRIIREGIVSSGRIDSLSMGAEVLYRRLMSVVDDYGRFYGIPATLRAACWPAHPEKATDGQVMQWMKELTAGDNPLLIRYEVGGIYFVQIENFGQKVRSKSKFPESGGAIQSSRDIRGNIYFIQSRTSKRIKIGFTELSPASRLGTLQTGSAEPLELLGSFEGSMADEKEAHKSLSEHRIAGEWFDCSDAVLQFMAAKCRKMPQNVRTSRIRISDANASLCAEAPAKLVAVPDPLQAEIDSTASRIHGRHPSVRSCGVSEIKSRLGKILKRHAVNGKTKHEVLRLVDDNHATECASEQWTKSGGEYAKGLANWLAPTEDRYLSSKVPDLLAGLSDYPQAPRYERQPGESGL